MAPTRRRRQNHACIQCKTSKKRCDGYILNAGQLNTMNRKRPLAGSDTSLNTSKQQVSPCSYCTRTQKQCSLSKTWVPSGYEDEQPSSTLITSVESPTNTIDKRSMLRAQNHQNMKSVKESASARMALTSIIDGDACQSQACFAYQSEVPADEHQPKNRKADHFKSRHLDDNRSEFATILSPFSPEYSISLASNNRTVSQSLLQIYHDVVENNLTCWVTGKTCPYQTIGISDHIDTIRIQSRDGMPPEWGSRWPNRMYQRVIQLDRVSQPEMIRLTVDENRAASRALDLAIMAFAAQWAQGSRRQTRFPATAERCPSPSENLAEVLAEEFEQKLQGTLWEQANMALQEICEVECFRVVYAEFILGLTQKPWISRDHVSEHRLGDLGIKGVTMGSLKASMVSEIADILSLEGPPVYLERAVRKMQTLKYQFQARQVDLSGNSSSHRHSQSSFSRQILGKQDTLTIGFLYWLLVMHDTVCMPMNERPVVLADTDCQTDALKEQRLDEGGPEILNVSHRWTLNHFLQDDPDAPQVLRWPCHYSAAAGAIIKSTPIKILLYRYVFYLQSALRNQEDSRLIESFLQGAISVCRYWKMTYGVFFRDLIQSYESVPPRLRTWFVCIHVAWNLGTFMLADLIDCIDSKELSKKMARSERRNTDMATKIRTQSVFELSELAKVTVATESIGLNDASEDQLPGYHFALGQSPLLTEPCTAIFTKAFTNASIYYLSAAFEVRNEGRSAVNYASKKRELQENLNRSQLCLRALWCLGKKSEVARNLALTIFQYLNIMTNT